MSQRGPLFAQQTKILDPSLLYIYCHVVASYYHWNHASITFIPERRQLLYNTKIKSLTVGILSDNDQQNYANRLHQLGCMHEPGAPCQLDI